MMSKRLNKKRACVVLVSRVRQTLYLQRYMRVHWQTYAIWVSRVPGVLGVTSLPNLL